MKHRTLATAAVAAVALGTTAFAASSASATAGGHPAALPGGFKHLVVIYEENHSFDNLYGSWGPVNGQSVKGVGDFERIIKSAKPGSYLRLYTLRFDQRSATGSPGSLFAVVQVPAQ